MSVISTIPPKFDCELAHDMSKAKTKAMLAEFEEAKAQMKDRKESFLVFVRKELVE